MGMDVIGRAPATEQGAMFRRSAWGWRALADYTMRIGGDVAAKCGYWHTNDGDGLDAEDSAALAEIIGQALESGEAERCVVERKAALDALPLVPCRFCEGTGVRNDDVGRKSGMVFKTVGPEEAERVDFPHPRIGQIGTCNACASAGMSRHPDTLYHLELEDIREWRAFLAACGGFEIH